MFETAELGQEISGAEYAERAEAALEGLEEGAPVEALRDAVSYAVGRSR